MSVVSDRRRLLGGSIGNLAEIFDYSVYALSAPALAVHFFPADHPTAALLGTFAVYAVAFFVRPLGGVLFGYLGDRVGRLSVLTATVLLMGAGTMLTGLLPTFDSIGVAATILLVFCRLLQGLSMGGETTGGWSYIAESAPEGKRGRWIGVAGCFAYVPNAAAALFIFGVQLGFGQEVYLEWGWRVPFLVGGLIAAVGFWLRYTLDDSEEFKDVAREREEAASVDTDGPAIQWRETLSARKSMVLVILTQVPQAVGAYLIQGYMFTYLVKVAGVDSTTALLSNAVGILVIGLGMLVFGRVGDRIGRKPLLFAGAIWLIVTAWPAFALAGSGTVAGAYFGQLLISVGVSVFASAYFVMSVELFPTAVRCRSHGISYNLAVAIFGGTTPLIATLLVNGTGSPLAPAWYAMILMTVLGLVGIIMTPETRGLSLRHSVGGHPSIPATVGTRTASETTAGPAV